MSKCVTKVVFAFVAGAARLCPEVSFHTSINFCKDGKVYVNVMHGSNSRIFMPYSPSSPEEWHTPQDVRDWVDKVPTRKKRTPLDTHQATKV